MNDRGWSELLGMRVIQSPLVQPVPVLQVSPTFQWCTDECRADMNQWLLEMFGKREVAYIMDMKAIGVGEGNCLALNPKMMALLRL